MDKTKRAGVIRVQVGEVHRSSALPGRYTVGIALILFALDSHKHAASPLRIRLEKTFEVEVLATLAEVDIYIYFGSKSGWSLTHSFARGL